MLESGCYPIHVYDHALSYEHLDLLNYLQIKYGDVYRVMSEMKLGTK